MRLRTSVLGLTLAALAATALQPSPAAAQRRGDQPRLVFTVMPGFVFGNDLWQVPNQPVLNRFNELDTFAIRRDIGSTLGVVFSGAYYPGDHVGFVGEAQLVGVGFDDGCRLVHSTGDPKNISLCNTLDTQSEAATAVALSGGVILRTASRRVVSPYGRLQLGLTLSNQSSKRVISSDNSGAEPVLVTIYPDEHNTRLLPSAAIGLGFTAALGPGYQLRWEARDNMIAMNTITGPTARDGQSPPTKMTVKHLPAIFIGLDVVLERRRGRRY
ncbi:MAG TPA: hypothetical protein VFS40_14980 [Gemmatimonadales bacterium]|nr:hypothetical protein [Gemmatimonadales bacterium]